MATSDSNWPEDEQCALLEQIVRAAWRVDISDMYTMGYLVLGASTSLSRWFGREVTWEQIVYEIMNIQQRLMNFRWFLGLIGVSFNDTENRITITNEYWVSGRKESWMMMGYRLAGEPMFRDLKVAFIFAKANEADFDWLLRSFEGEEGVYLSGDSPWPRKNAGMTAGFVGDGF